MSKIQEMNDKRYFMKVILNIILVISCCAIFSVSAQKIEATDYRFNYEGRVIKDWVNFNVSFNWPGSKVSFRFTGKQLAIRMNGQGASFDLLVDGHLYKTLTTGNKMSSYPLLEFSESQDVLIELVKRGETVDLMVVVDSFQSDEGEIAQSRWVSNPHFLFIGDSFSAGFASESIKFECSAEERSVTSNARIAFPAKTAQFFDATHTQVSYSSMGLLRNFSGKEVRHDLRYYADKAGAIFDNNDNFEDRFPHLIIVQLGTNDFNTDIQSHEPWSNLEAFSNDWVTMYVEFIASLRSRYPDVPVVLIGNQVVKVGKTVLITNDLIVGISKVEDRLFDHGRSGINSFTMPAADFSGCWGHPNAEQHSAIANSLTNFIRKLGLLN